MGCSLNIALQNCYATDSAALIAKAKKLLQVASNIEDLQARNISVPSTNPLGRRWSLQPDGDLWELAWTAILKRGTKNQKESKRHKMSLVTVLAISANTGLGTFTSRSATLTITFVVR